MPSEGSSRAGARALSRAATKRELSAIALDVALARGYAATTVEDIRAAAQISRATFFRYFPTKEDAVLGETLDSGDVLLEALRARPRDEAPWPALRRAFDPLVERYDDPRARRLAHLVVSTPALATRHHEKHVRVAQDLRPEVARRLAPRAADHAELAAAAIVAAMFACVEAAVWAWVSDDPPPPLAELLDRAMAAVGAGGR